MRKCLITGGGRINNLGFLKKSAEECDYIIAADKGYEALKKAGVDIDIAIGDFDSLGCVPEDVIVKKLKAEKDDTDTMTAVRYALENGAKEILILGGTGGRLDHTVANLQTLSFIAEHGALGKLIDETNEIMGLIPGEYSFKKRIGYSLSVFSMTDEATGLCESGVKYPLDNAVLTNKFPLGISNEIVEDFAVISFKSGTLFVCISEL